MAPSLTAGAISILSSDGWKTADLKPVLQVTDIRTVQGQTPTIGGGGENKERYRVALSDGSFQQQGMLATQRNELVRNQQLQKGSIVQLTEFICNPIRDRMIIIIIDLELILDKCDIIGDPRPFIKQPGNEIPSITRCTAPMQPSLNQPARTVTDAQCGPRPTSSYMGPPVHTPAPQQTAGLHSYGNNYNNNNAESAQPYANNRMQPIQPTYNQPPPVYANRGPAAKNEGPLRVIPIAALNPYQSKWTIKARVNVKGNLRNYKNARGDGKVFSFDLLDSDSGEIRVTCFNAVADQFYNQIEVGKVYYISRGSIKPAQRAFNHLKHDYEITLDNTSTIQPCFDDDTSIPAQQFHFRNINEIENMENSSVLDVIGVVTKITPPSLITRKTGDETTKQVLTLTDMSERSVNCTLWGNFCNAEGQTIQKMCDSGQNPILAVKSAKVYDYNGKSIGTVSSSQLAIDPDFPEARKLKTWFETVGKNTATVSMSQDLVARNNVRKTLSHIKDEKLGTFDKIDWVTVNATIWHMRFENFCYTGCPLMVGDRKCSKKVVKNEDGKWRCDRCDKTVDECEYRYMLQFQIQDHTGLVWVTAFQETGEGIMGISAKELYFIKNEEQDEDKFMEIVRNALYNEYTFVLKVKEEVYGDNQRSIKHTVFKVEKMSFATKTKDLLTCLQNMHKKGDPIAIPANLGVNPQIGSPFVGSSGNIGGSNECYKCNQSGHWARDCPGVSNVVQPMHTGGGNNGVSNECYKCHQSGHWARDCPGVSNVGSGQFDGGMRSGGGNSGQCFKCNQTGHWARDCPGASNVSSYGRNL